jgi:hypothetical protein
MYAARKQRMEMQNNRVVWKKRIKDGRRSAATPPGSKQDYATISRNVSSPKGECGDTHHIDASVSDARRSNGNSTEDQIPKVDLVD